MEAATPVRAANKARRDPALPLSVIGRSPTAPVHDKPYCENARAPPQWADSETQSYKNENRPAPDIGAMKANRSTLTRFYSALAHLDPDAMACCYAPDVHFQDEVFSLDGRDQVMAMWRMLCTSAQARGRADWKLNYRVISVNAETGRMHWSAHYRFGKIQRPVHNRIRSTFHFNEAGQITRHHDQFDFWRWSRQALGLPGLLLGWSPLLRQQVRSKALLGLNRHLAENPVLTLARPDPTEGNH